MRFLPRVFSKSGKLPLAAIAFLKQQQITEKPLNVIATPFGHLAGFRNHLAWLAIEESARIWGWEEIQGLRWNPEQNQLLILAEPKLIITKLPVKKDNDFMALASERIAATTVISKTEEIQGNKITVAIRRGLRPESKAFFAVYIEPKILLSDPRIQLRIKEIKKDLDRDYKI